MQAISIFCQDIRYELNEIVSLMGILPDNVNAVVDTRPGHTSFMQKLVIYTRINLRPDEHVDSLETFLRAGSGDQIGINKVEPEVIETARRQAAEQGSPYAGIIVRLEAGNFPIAPGRVEAVVRCNGVEHLSGFINLSSVPAAQGAY